MNDLVSLINNGYISKNKHPEYDIYILNYTAKTQYESFWNETTKSCRGLIVDSKNKPISRCFEKFFNYNEVKKQVDFLLEKKENFTIFEKYDGSLGVSYYVDGQFHIATRGSFTSPQAVRATKILRNKYCDLRLNPELAYLFEIIYPENRIVLNYDFEDIVLLAVIDIKNNKELDLTANNPGFLESRSYSFDLDDLLKHEIQNFEGYVVRFENGFRFKVKLQEYVRLHKLIFGLSNKDIWESLKEGKNLDLNNIPDEIFTWIKHTKNKMLSEYNSIEKECIRFFDNIKNLERKSFANKALDSELSSVLFKMYDNKDYSNIIWDKIKPTFSTYKESDYE